MHCSHKHLCNHGAESYLVFSNNYCNTPWIITAHLLNFGWSCLWSRRKFSGSFSNLLLNMPLFKLHAVCTGNMSSGISFAVYTMNWHLWLTDSLSLFLTLSLSTKSYTYIDLSVYCYIRPLLKLVDRLLLVGMLTDEDVAKLLIMIDPETWDESFQKGNFLCVG